MNILLRIYVILIVSPIIWVMKVFFKKNRLKNLTLVDLGSSIESVIELYGDPDESEFKGDGITEHTFVLVPFFTVVIDEVDGVVNLATYWSEHPDPNDLKAVADKYGEGIGWDELEDGHLYWRKDELVKMWCSAIPAIGVSYKDYYPPADEILPNKIE